MGSDHWTGRTIDGRYVVEATLGQGGMGVVLRARHQFTGAVVALKMVRPDLVGHAEIQDRFLAEARAPSTIGHPGIVQVLDAGRTADGELYLAMELLAGQPLRQAMAAGVARAEARRVVLALLDALAAAHARGIVHRDLKPENVFLHGPERAVKLLDFGIAKVLEARTGHAGHASQTAAGAVLGTVAYMAPEQLVDASTVDHRADLWAVAVIAYELISGQLPYRGSLAQVMQALATRDPDPIQAHVAVPPEVAAWFARALARDRGARFGSAHELAQAFAALPLAGDAPPRAAVAVAGAGATLATGGAPISPHGATVATGAPGPAGAAPSAPAWQPAVPPPPGPAPVAGASHAPATSPRAPWPAAPAAPVPPPHGPGGFTPPGLAPRPGARPAGPPPPRGSTPIWPYLAIGGGVVAVAIVAIVAVRGAATGRGADRSRATCETLCRKAAECGARAARCVDECVAEVTPAMQACATEDGCEAFARCLIEASD